MYILNLLMPCKKPPNQARTGPTRPSDTLPLATLRVRCPQIRHLNLERDSKYTGRIWRGIWLRVFSAPKQSPRPPEVSANRWVLGEMERINGDSE